MISFLKSRLKIPKVQLSLILFLIFFSTVVAYPLNQSIFLLINSLGFCLIFDLLFTYIRNRKFFIPHAAVVTGLIITLIVDPQATWYQIGLISAIAMATKNFLRISNRHIFNPASTGLLFGGIIFNLGVSWWGVSFQNIIPFNMQSLILFIILLSPILVSGYELRRFGSILSFFIIYIFVSFFGSPSFLSELLNPGTIFFATVMLPEPMTSPVNLKRQILYGVLVALIALILSYPFITAFLSSLLFLPDIFIPALLLGNLLFFKFR